MNKMIQFKNEETDSLLFRTAADLLHVKCVGIHETVAALVKCGASELYAKSVVVHVMTKFYIAR